jgi:hypothetical protein
MLSKNMSHGVDVPVGKTRGHNIGARRAQRGFVHGVRYTKRAHAGGARGLDAGRRAQPAVFDSRKAELRAPNGR